MDSRFSPLADASRRAKERIQAGRIFRVFGYSDFRFLWVGAFLSFTGSWVQNVAQGYYVFDLTHDESKLAFVSFCSSLPMFFFGLLAGSLADMFNKRTVLVITQALFAAGAFYLAVATYFHVAQYWQIVLVAFLLGIVSCIEIPTRQSIIGKVVPPQDLSAAIPIQAMTFNVARIFGPALGGLMLAMFGVPVCYLVNGISFLALIWAALMIKANLQAVKQEPQPMMDLLMEGMLYTFRDVRLKAIFILESVSATFGLFYIALLPAYVAGFPGMAKRLVWVNGKYVEFDPTKQALAMGYTVVGIGALIGLLVIVRLADSRHKGTIIRASMWIIGLGLVTLSFVPWLWLAYPVLAFIGMATIAQLNTTNALFQLLSPERLRGRVLAMHIWALNGLSPFGVLFLGWVASASRDQRELWIWESSFRLPGGGLSLALQVGGTAVIVGAIAAVLSRRGLANLVPE